MKKRRSMTLLEFVREQRNPNWGHFTEEEDDFKNNNPTAFPILEETTHSTLTKVSRTKSSDGQWHVWYDAGQIKVGDVFWKITKRGTTLRYVREDEDEYALYV